MEAKKHIVFLVSRFPYPLEKGDKLRAFYQIKELSKHFDITLICTSDQVVSKAQHDELQSYCKQIHCFQLTKGGLLIELVKNLLNSKPIQVQYFYRRSIHVKIKKILQEIKPAHIVCQLVRMSEYVKNEHYIPKTLDYMDALSKGMERRIQTEAWFKRWFFRTECKRLRQYERRIFDYFEYKTIISEQDRKLIFHPDNHQIEIVPNGIDESFFSQLPVSKEFDLVFTGNFSYAPNIDAACCLAEQILPALKKEGISCSLLLSGANPAKKVLALQSDQVTVSGWVDDIRTSYQKAHLFVAPLFIGTGLQNKLLEAMASELPCITTPLVNNALGAEENEAIFLAKDTEEFVTRIQECMTETEKSKTIALNGKKYVEEHFSWKTQCEKLVKIIQSA